MERLHQQRGHHHERAMKEVAHTIIAHDTHINKPTRGISVLVYKALGSAGGFQLLRLIKAKKHMSMLWKWTEAHAFPFKLTTCQCQELHASGIQPGRRAHV